MTDQRRARGAATRERLLNAARTLFGEHGYDATSIEAVLDASGVARGALYHHFKSKAELFDAVLESVVAELAGEATEVAGERQEPLESLRIGSHAWLRMALDPAIQRIALLDPPTVVGWTRWRELDEQYWLGGLRAEFGRLAREGRVPESQVQVLAYLLCAALTEGALFIAYAEDQQAAANVVGAAVDTLLDRLAGGVAPSQLSGRRRSA